MENVNDFKYKAKFRDKKWFIILWTHGTAAI